MIATAVAQSGSTLIGDIRTVGPVCLVFTVAALAAGYWLPRFCGVAHDQSVASSMEAGIQNSALAIAAAVSPALIGSPRMAAPALVYGVLVLFAAAVSGLLEPGSRVRPRHAGEEPAVRPEHRSRPVTPPIDLRSDTFTRPTAPMRQAMAAADVGDDVWGEDPTVRALEAETARLLGKESALYVPSGHMSNQLAVYVLTRSGEEVWAHRDSHLLSNEQGAVSVLSRALPRAFSSPEGVPESPLLESWLQGADDIHRARPSLVSVENTFTGRVIPLAEQRRVTGFAAEHGLYSHLDGARLWNAAVALDVAPAEVAAGFDTVSVCFSKGLGAPVGSALAGSATTIARARRGRKLLGGGMRQAGIIAAGALYALRHHIDRLADDHARAVRLAEGIGAAEGVIATAHTNMVLVEVPRGRAAAYSAAFARHGVACAPISADLVRMVVHLEIGDAAIDAAVARVHEAVRTLNGG